jgi:DNA/RNA-binding domain of Phe-tRNA-synthetase-like protein
MELLVGDSLAQFLKGSSVDQEVFALRPDYRALQIGASGLTPGPSDASSDRLLSEAEDSARAALSGTSVEDLPPVTAWRDAYRSFGAKPQRTRNSLEALLRRASTGLPRVNRLTDIYNAISVLWGLPIGGEDLSQYVGSPRLTRALGEERFDTAAQGLSVVEHPEEGEVIWRDEVGVTCRRWNWRQCRRTQLDEGSTEALFILDVLDPMTDDVMLEAAAALERQLAVQAPNATFVRRLIRHSPDPMIGD